jgi:hypothetical protein
MIAPSPFGWTSVNTSLNRTPARLDRGEKPHLVEPVVESRDSIDRKPFNLNL